MEIRLFNPALSGGAIWHGRVVDAGALKMMAGPVGLETPFAAPSGSGSDARATLERLACEMRAQGYRDVRPSMEKALNVLAARNRERAAGPDREAEEESDTPALPTTVCVEYDLGDMQPMEALAKRNIMSVAIETMLEREGLGGWNGGSMGMGTYESYFVSTDPERTVAAIRRELAGTEFADYVRIYAAAAAS